MEWIAEKIAHAFYTGFCELTLYDALVAYISVMVVITFTSFVVATGLGFFKLFKRKR